MFRETHSQTSFEKEHKELSPAAQKLGFFDDGDKRSLVGKIEIVDGFQLNEGASRTEDKREW